MSRFNYTTVIKYRVKAETVAPLHIGSSIGDNEAILIDTTTNAPFIQASSLAGMLRAYSEIVNGNEMTGCIFGHNISESNKNPGDNRSRIKVCDGIFDRGTIKIELRPNVSIDEKTGSVSSSKGSGQKFDMEYIGSGAVFSFDMYVFIDDDKQREAVENAFTILVGEEAQLGAKKSSGAGRFVASSIKRIVYDLKTAEGRAAWVNEEDDDCFEDISLVANQKTQYKYVVTVDGVTEGPILIKGIGVNGYGQDNPDSANMRNSKGEYIIPGTSIRGVLRAQMERISSYLGVDKVIESAFGVMAAQHKDSHKGNLIFSDITIGEIEDNDLNPIRHRIHIDKLTGGVINGQLFSEKNAAGRLKNFVINIQDEYNPDAVLGLLLYALRDMSIHTMNLGGGFSIGKGFVNVEKISVRCHTKESTINMVDGTVEVEDTDGLIKLGISALREVKA